MEEMDKLLEDLQRVSVDLNNQLSKYEALMYHTEQANEKLDKYTESNREKVDRLCIRVEKRLEDIHQYVESMFKETGDLMEQYTRDSAALNQEEREAFSKALLEGLKKYREEFLGDVTKLTEAARETNEEMVTQVHGLRVVINGCLEAINHTIGSINDRYVSIFEEFSGRVSRLNQEERTQFIKELSQTLEQYKKDYGICDELLKDSHKTNQELTRLTLQNVERVQEVRETIENSLGKTESLMKYIQKAYEEGFSDFAKDVTALNDREKEKFVVTIRSVLEDYRFTFGNEIEGKSREMNTLFQNTLAGICSTFVLRNQEYQKILEKTRESNEAFHKELEESLTQIQGLVNSLLFREKTIKEALGFLKEDYKNTVWQYVQEIEQSNAVDRERFIQEVIQSTNAGTEKFMRQLENFKGERNSYLQQMEQLLQEERRDRESMLNRQAESINLLKREQEVLKRQLQTKQEALNRYQVITGTVTMVFMAICLLLLLYMIEPGIFAAVCVLMVLAAGVAITLYRKQIIKWLEQKKSSKKKKEFHRKDENER
ncbi:MAG: hypothetical protein IKL22_01040 [Lachnospiraceae bacterium]|nr:hypothetical protein [Lachnospiraceae bacterium]